MNAFLGKAVGDLGAAVSAVLVSIGDELGFYKALATGPLTARELAAKTGTHERYVREWLANQAAGGYVEYDAASETFSLSPEQALCLADPNGPVDVPGAYSIVRDLFHVRDRALENFRTGQGHGVGRAPPVPVPRHRALSSARAINANLLTSWLPALDGAVDKLKEGARVADVGCGHGASTILMAQAFPKSTFVGIDYHASSIDTAQQRAAAAGVSNARFEVADATSYHGDRYDLIAFFDCLHDMADPGRRGAARTPDAQRRRTCHGRRAVRERSPRGQSQSGGPGLLRRVDDGLRAGVAGEERSGARRAGRRAAAPRHSRE